MNLAIIDTKQLILNTIADSKLPAVICSMIMHEITANIDGQANQILVKEKENFEAANKVDEDKVKKVKK